LENLALRRNVVYLPFSEPTILNDWKPKLISLKEILEKLGLTDIRFASQQKEKRNNNLGNSRNNNKLNSKEKRSNSNLSSGSSVNNRRNLNKLSLLQE
jgi:hypothetical protein